MYRIEMLQPNGTVTLLPNVFPELEDAERHIARRERQDDPREWHRDKRPTYRIIG